MAFRARLLEQLVKPTTLAVYRLVLADAGRGRGPARKLDEAGRGSVVSAVTTFFAAAQRRGLIRAVDPSRPASTFLALLLGDLVFRLVLGVAPPPPAEERHQRAQGAAKAVALLYGGTH